MKASQCLLIWLLPALAAADPVIDTWPKTEMRQVVDRVDELLGGSRTDDNKSTSTLRLTGSEQISRDEPSVTQLNVRYNLKLGLIERWQQELQHWSQEELHKVESDLLKEIPVSTGHSGTAVERSAPPGPTRPQPKDPWRFSVEKHLVIARHPDFWAHARARKDWEGRHLVQTASAEVGWSLKNKWESLLGAVTSTRLAPRWALSLGHQVQWLISDKSFSTSHGPSLSYLPGVNQVLSLSAAVSTAVTGKVWYADGYSVNAGYRLAAWQEWLLVSVNPSLNFSKAQRFHGDPGLSASVEFVF